MQPWEVLARATAPDGKPLELRRRVHELRIRAGAHELMSSEDEPSSQALARLGAAHVAKEDAARVLIGGLGMGFTLRAALDMLGPRAIVEVAELVPAVVAWNEGVLGELAGHPLRDSRTELYIGDVRERIVSTKGAYDAILLDVDNGPNALAHRANDALYGDRGLGQARAGLRIGGVLAVWSGLDDPRFTRRLERNGFATTVHRVFGSRRDRGKRHVIWVAVRSARGAGSRRAR